MMSNIIASSIKTQKETVGVPQQNADDLRAELYKMKPANMQDSLPHSPYLKSRRTGEVFPWCEQFASRPDLMECCDEAGNPITIPEFNDEKPISYNTDISHLNVGSEKTPPVGLASELLGVDDEHSIDYTEKTNVKDTFSLPPQEQSVAVSDLIGAVLKDNL